MAEPPDSRLAATRSPVQPSGVAPGIDPLAGDFFRFADELTDDERKIVAGVREFLRKPTWNRSRWSTGSAPEFPQELIALFRDSQASPGFPTKGLRAPPAVSDPVLIGMLAMEMARTDASVSTFFGVHNGLAMYTIYPAAAPEQRDRWLPAMAAMDKIGAFAMTEPLGGSDVAGGMRTTARRDGDTGSSTAPRGGSATRPSPTSRRLGPGRRRQPRQGLRRGEGHPRLRPPRRSRTRSPSGSCENADITLTDVRVPGGRTASRTSTPSATSRRSCAPPAAGGLAGAGRDDRRLRTRADYAKERQQFGRPIGRFQLVQDLLVKSLGNITASWGMLVQLARLQDAGIFRDEHSSLAKAFVTSRMREVVAWSREIFGGNGICWTTTSPASSPTPRHLLLRGHPQMNTLIVGKAITGQSAFV